MTLRRAMTIVNEKGLHARASAKVVSLTEGFASEVTIRHDGEDADARSIMDLLTLGAARGSVLEVEAVGEDAEKALDALEALIANRFGEEN